MKNKEKEFIVVRTYKLRLAIMTIGPIIFEVDKDNEFGRPPEKKEKPILDQKYKDLAEMYFGETDENREKRILELREKVMSTSPELLHNMPGNGNDFLLMLLRSGNFEVDAAINMLKNYIKLLTSGRKYFELAFDEGSPKIKQSYNQRIQSLLPSRDKFGRRVLLFSLGLWNPDVLQFSEIFSSGYMLAEMAAQEEKTQIAGMTVICDCAGFGFKQFTSISLTDLKYAAMLAQDHFPMWFRGIHLMNCPRLSYVMYQMVKPMLNQRIRDAIVFHNSNESLHKYVDKEILPQELGGDTGKISNEESSKAVLEMPHLFRDISKYIYRSSLSA